MSKSKLIIIAGASVFIGVLLLLGWHYQQKLSLKEMANQAKTQKELLSFPDFQCNISDFGAVGDGLTKNTKAIEDAIRMCSEKGGGRIVIPKGDWLTGPIHLKSNVNLALEEGANLIFSSDFDDYLPVVFSRFEGIELYNYSPMIYANNCENVAITGKGKIIGQGEKWWDWKQNQKETVKKLYDMAYGNIPVNERIFGKATDALRPSMVQFVNCKNIDLSKFTVENGPMWTIHFVYSENVKIKNVKIYTNGPNTDGIVVDSSKDVLISECYFETGDDAISIKSGLDNDGWRVNRPSEDITISHCQIKKGSSGVAIGSEMSGGIKNVSFENSQISNVDQGFRIKSLPGRGGIIENISVSNLQMENIAKYAIQLDMLYEFSTVNSKNSDVPLLKNVRVSNITATNVQEEGIRIVGLPEKEIQDVSLENIKIDSRKGIKLKDADKINFSNLEMNIMKSPMFDLKKVKDIYINNLSCKQPLDILLLLIGNESENINVSDLKCKSASKLNLRDGANSSSVIFNES